MNNLEHSTDFLPKIKEDLGEHFFDLLSKTIDQDEIINIIDLFKQFKNQNIEINPQIIDALKQFYFSVILIYGEELNNIKSSKEELYSNIETGLNLIIEQKEENSLLFFNQVKEIYSKILNKKWVHERQVSPLSRVKNGNILSVLLDNKIIKKNFLGYYVIKNKISDEDLLTICKKEVNQTTSQIDNLLEYLKKYKNFLQKDK